MNNETKVRHTPGPWKVHNESDRTGWRGISIAAADETHVANVVMSLRDQERANARLIAAAPDLLAALRLMLQSHDHSCLEAECRIFGVDAARAAIAKAEGGAL